MVSSAFEFIVEAVHSNVLQGWVRLVAMDKWSKNIVWTTLDDANFRCRYPLNLLLKPVEMSLSHLPYLDQHQYLNPWLYLTKVRHSVSNHNLVALALVSQTITRILFPWDMQKTNCIHLKGTILLSKIISKNSFWKKIKINTGRGKNVGGKNELLSSNYIIIKCTD